VGNCIFVSALAADYEAMFLASFFFCLADTVRHDKSLFYAANSYVFKDQKTSGGRALDHLL
jgi:hypothetical protein